MPIDTPSEDYECHVAQWDRLRDAIAGEDAVKAKAGDYLRRPSAMKWDDFHQYARCASWFPATSRTLDGLVGAVFRKQPVVTIPARMAPLLDDVDRLGTPFVPFAKKVVREVLAMGRHGVLVDMAGDGGEPYLAAYNAESIVNARIAVVDGQPVLTLLVLKEVDGHPKDEDRFTTKAVTRYRLLEMARVGDGAAVYVVTLYEERRDGKIDRVAGPTIPVRRGEPLRSIPFTFFGPTDLSPAIEQSPLLGLATENFSHFRTTAEHENSLWFAGSPQFVISGSLVGDNAGVDELQVGANTIWMLEKEGRATVLQGAAENVGALRQALQDKQARLAVLGARLLEPQQKGGVESAEAIGLRHRGEDSILASVSDTVSRGLTRVLSTLIWWAGGGESEASVELNKDFFEKAMTADTLLKMTAAWQQGAFGGAVLYHNLKTGERLPEGMTFEDWARDIDQHGPAAAFLGSEDEAA